MAPPLAADNIQLLALTTAVIEGLEDAVYREPDGTFPGGSVGGHVRHMHDHYRLLLDGWPARRVDYEQRARDTRIENERAYAVQCLAGVIAALHGLPVAAGDTALAIQSACGEDGSERWCQSTLRRELDYLAAHDVHHHALIAFMLKRRHVRVPPGFGVAASTRHYLQSQQPCVR